MNEVPDIAQFKRIAIPLVRRIYPQLIANKIMSVQPMAQPASLANYLRYRYSENKQPVPDETWTVKKKKKKIWRDIYDEWEPNNVE